MKNTLLIFCEDIIIDASTGQWSFIKNIEKINMVFPPGKRKEGQAVSVKGKFNLAAMWSVDERDAGKEKMKIKYELTDQGGNKLTESPEYEVPIKRDIPAIKHKVTLSKIALKDSGRYYFKLLREEEGGSYREENKVAFDVSIRESEEGK